MTGRNGTQSSDVAAPHETAHGSPLPTLNELLTADPDQFVAKYTDIGAINLACARGLPNCDDSEFPKYMALLDTIADAVRRHTERSWRLFKLKPAVFNHSENVFRLFTMEHVFRVQFGIRYDPVVREATKNGKPWNTSDSTEIFIHGLLGPKRTGTCSSLPTFAIAVGRRLGYPLKLILVPTHTLYRWDDGQEIFNLQPTEAGGELYPDEYFHQWPRPWDEIDRQINARTKVWLHSMTPRQEVSKFLCNRAIMLRQIKRYAEAFQSLDAAERFDPVNPATADIRCHMEQRMMTGLVSMFSPQQQIQGTFPAGTNSPRVEPGRDELLNTINPFRDRSKDPRHLNVRITRIPDNGQPPLSTIFLHWNPQKESKQ
jgi:hypothetical protein